MACGIVDSMFNSPQSIVIYKKVLVHVWYGFIIKNVTNDLPKKNPTKQTNKQKTQKSSKQTRTIKQRILVALELVFKPSRNLPRLLKEVIEIYKLYYCLHIISLYS